MMIRIAMLAILLMAFHPTTNAQPYRGGSNYNWFHIEGCQREPYGVLSNYHLFRNEVDAQLKQMASGGQQRLRIGVFHARNANTGTVIPSNGGNLPLQQRENLRDLMISAKNAGFIEVVVAFFPQLDNGPGSWAGATWNSSHEEYFQENWNLIANLMPYMRESKIKFLVDLMNEGSPPSSAPYLWREYTKKMWANFTYIFGRAETIGFSIPTNSADRIAFLPELYGPLPPYVLDFHLYGNEKNQLKAIDASLNAISWPQGIIIGESYYNDATSASDISSAASGMSRAIYFALQWPMTRTSTCADVDVAPPSDFNNYILQGL
ncbi:hypothetical protein [Stenotrophomonas hibiscicola]|uniref:hypothetical protein n=1 Tax=Stenotrophomonas hibiscicola TaxID=86189 RepID=UPI002E7684E3|nr:hypothetical protein [[Pseudomonas] hibiscicola]